MSTASKELELAVRKELNELANLAQHLVTRIARLESMLFTTPDSSEPVHLEDDGFAKTDEEEDIQILAAIDRSKKEPQAVTTSSTAATNSLKRPLPYTDFDQFVHLQTHGLAASSVSEIDVYCSGSGAFGWAVGVTAAEQPRVRLASLTGSCWRVASPNPSMMAMVIGAAYAVNYKTVLLKIDDPEIYEATTNLTKCHPSDAQLWMMFAKLNEMRYKKRYAPYMFTRAVDATVAVAADDAEKAAQFDVEKPPLFLKDVWPEEAVGMKLSRLL